MSDIFLTIFDYFLYLILPVGIISFVGWKTASSKQAVYASLSAIILFLIMFEIFLTTVEHNDLTSRLTNFVYFIALIGAFVGMVIGALIAKKFTKKMDIFLVIFILTFGGMIALASFSIDITLMLFAFDIIKL